MVSSFPNNSSSVTTWPLNTFQLARLHCYHHGDFISSENMMASSRANSGQSAPLLSQDLQLSTAVGFQQQGTVDWTKVLSGSVAFSVHVLSRLSKVGIEAFTIYAARAIFSNVKDWSKRRIASPSSPRQDQCLSIIWKSTLVWVWGQAYHMEHVGIYRGLELSWYLCLSDRRILDDSCC